LTQILSQLSQTGDALSDAVDETLRARAEDGLRQMR